MEPNKSERLERQLTLNWILLAVVVIAFVWPSLKSWVGFGGRVSAEPRAVTPRGELADFEKSTIEIFNAVSPSVVYITTKTRVQSRYSWRSVEVSSGSGSGFIWDQQGHIVTNFHVLQGATSARVVLNDQTTYEASLVGGSADHDLAVLRIRAPVDKLQPVPIGESDTLQVGQSVYAIGNPFGLNQSLATGVVSAKSRTIESPNGHSIEDVIQTDAAINPGNSGGPLLDSAGRLVGVNTAIYSPSGASAGIGFSIPVYTVNRVVPQIIEQGRYTPPTIGIRVNRELSRVITRRLGVNGVVLLDVLPGSAAEDVGLRGTIIGRSELVQLGDIIQSVNGVEVQNMDELLGEIEKHERGEVIELGFLRKGNRQTADVTLQ